METVLTQDLGYLLSRVSGRMIQTTNAALADSGLRVRQYSVLTLACEHPTGISQRDLAGTLGLDPSQVVALVDELEAAALVQRRADPADRRTRLITATGRGRRVRRTAAARAADGQQELLAPLGAADRQQLRELLVRLLGEDATARSA